MRKPAIIPRPQRKRHRIAASTKQRKTHNKHNHLGSTVQSGRDKVVVLDKKVRVVFTQPELTEETYGEVAGAGGVDANEEVAHVPEDDGQIDVLEEADPGVSVEYPKWYRNSEPNQKRQCHPLVTRSDREHVACNAPSDG